MLNKESIDMVLEMRSFFQKENLPDSRTDFLKFERWISGFNSFLKAVKSSPDVKSILNYTDDGGVGCLTLVGCVDNFLYTRSVEIIDKLLCAGADFCPSIHCLSKTADFSNCFDKFISVMDKNELSGFPLTLSGFSGNILHQPEVLARYIGDCLHYDGGYKSEGKWLSECRASDGLPPIHVWWDYYIEGVKAGQWENVRPGFSLESIKKTNNDRMIVFSMECLDVVDQAGIPLWQKIFTVLEKGVDFSKDETFLLCGIIPEVESLSLQAKTLPAVNKGRPHRL